MITKRTSIFKYISYLIGIWSCLHKPKQHFFGKKYFFSFTFYIQIPCKNSLWSGQNYSLFRIIYFLQLLQPRDINNILLLQFSQLTFKNTPFLQLLEFLKLLQPLWPPCTISFLAIISSLTKCFFIISLQYLLFLTILLIKL